LTLEGAEGFAFVHALADIGHIDKHNVGKLILRVVSQTDFRGIAADYNPFIIFGIFRVIWGFPISHSIKVLSVN